MEAELRDSAKDQAELNMIVDLERNDLGRVCRIGSVSVPSSRELKRIRLFFTAWRPSRDNCGDVSFVDLLGATFPGGSVTGAPKIRAMQIIDELEPVRRGPYCGAVGYLAADGTMEFNVAIRTMIVAGRAGSHSRRRRHRGRFRSGARNMRRRWSKRRPCSRRWGSNA
jgi:para-aminobenzoate synthetase component I